MNIPKERAFIAHTISGEVVSVNRRQKNLYLNDHPVLMVTLQQNGTILAITESTNLFSASRYMFSGAAFWDILYDYPPTKDYAGQMEALHRYFQSMSLTVVARSQEDGKSESER